MGCSKKAGAEALGFAEGGFVEDSNPASKRQVGGGHYKDYAIQPAQFSEANGLSFLEGCVVKRVARWRRGGKGVEDLDKAIHELQLLKEYGK